MASLDEDVLEFELVQQTIKLGGLLDLNPYKFASTPENLKLLDAINDLRTQFISDPETELKIPELLRNPIKGVSDFDYIGSKILSDFAIKHTLQFNHYYKWVKNRDTFKFCDVRKLLPDHCRNNLAINLKLFEYVKLPIKNFYIYNHELEVYKFLLQNKIKPSTLMVYSIWNLEVLKYLCNRYNITRERLYTTLEYAVENNQIDVVKYLSNGGHYIIASKYSRLVRIAIDNDYFEIVQIIIKYRSYDSYNIQDSIDYILQKDGKNISPRIIRTIFNAPIWKRSKIESCIKETRNPTIKRALNKLLKFKMYC